MVRPELAPADALFGDAKLETPASVQDFWRWAYGDLCDDDVKGAFAEWMIGRLLGIPHKRRVTWANSDLITPEGVRIEVKSSALWQSWKLLDEFGQPKAAEALALHPIAADRRVVFRGLRARDAVGPNVAGQRPDLKSHLYVFCMHIEVDPQRWNALDLGQWQFFLASRDDVASWSSSSVTLAKLRGLLPALSARQFQMLAPEAIAKVAFELSQVGDQT